MLGLFQPVTATPRLRQAFLSHSKDDSRLRFFEEACSAAGVILKKMELEDPEFPPWRSIRREVGKSQIVFVSLSEPLQRLDYRHTQNWIDYEVGLACQRELPVWVFEPFEVQVDFPIPYCTHTVRFDHSNVDHVKWLKGQLEYLRDHGAGRYGNQRQFPSRRYDGTLSVRCLNPRCGLEFFQLNSEGDFWCPSCREPMEWKPKEEG